MAVSVDIRRDSRYWHCSGASVLFARQRLEHDTRVAASACAQLAACCGAPEHQGP
jgi:hypothetical protein